MATVRIPTPLRSFTGNEATLQAPGATVGQALDELVARYPALKTHLYNEQGQLRSFVTIFRNDEDIRYLEKEATPLRETDEVSIIPSTAGGL